MEISNFYKGTDNVTIHAIEHDIVLTQDIVFDYISTGKIRPVLKLNTVNYRLCPHRKSQCLCRRGDIDDLFDICTASEHFLPTGYEDGANGFLTGNRIQDVVEFAKHLAVECIHLARPIQCNHR